MSTKELHANGRSTSGKAPPQFAALGYTHDPADPLIDAPPKPRPEPRAILELTEFDCGSPFAPILVDLYFSVDARVSGRWPAPGVTSGEHNFFNWINSPSVEDDRRAADLPVITKLGADLHRSRRDLQRQ